MNSTVKPCSRCGERPRTSGVYCHPCSAVKARESRARRDNRGRRCNECADGVVTARTGYKCSACATARSQADRGLDDDLVRRRYLKSKYGLTLEQYNEILESQGGGCAICHKEPVRNPLCVDHDHRCCPGSKTCGKCVRGLLCVYCNSTVGKLETGSFEPHLAYIAERSIVLEGAA